VSDLVSSIRLLSELASAAEPLHEGARVGANSRVRTKSARYEGKWPASGTWREIVVAAEGRHRRFDVGGPDAEVFGELLGDLRAGRPWLPGRCRVLYRLLYNHTSRTRTHRLRVSRDLCSARPSAPGARIGEDLELPRVEAVDSQWRVQAPSANLPPRCHVVRPGPNAVSRRRAGRPRDRPRRPSPPRYRPVARRSPIDRRRPHHEQEPTRGPPCLPPRRSSVPGSPRE